MIVRSSLCVKRFPILGNNAPAFTVQKKNAFTPSGWHSCSAPICELPFFCSFKNG